MFGQSVTDTMVVRDATHLKIQMVFVFVLVFDTDKVGCKIRHWSLSDLSAFF